MRRAGMLGLAVALAVAMAPARAVDVDRIEIRSGMGEPLLAEIPITDATPQELAQLQAQLASATTFARSGLPRPQGVVADLQFEVVRGPRPVIRVTSAQPVQQDFLTFLLQVDAPQGRLVREYSISLGAASSMPSAVAPAIQAPVQAPDSAIVRQPDPADALPAPAVDMPAVAMPEAAAPAIPVVAPPPAPIPLSSDSRRPPPRPPAAPRPAAPRSVPPRRAASAPNAPAPRAAVRAAPARPVPAPPAAATRPGPADYTVRAGDNLSGVVERMDFAGITEQQALLALLRTNPDAFGKGNINQLRSGAVLRRPAATELTRLDPAAAEALVRLQIEQWRSGDMPTPPPAPAAPPAAASAQVQPAQAPAASAPAGPTAVAPARLEIAPGAPADSVGAGSGSAGGATPSERAAADQLAARYTEFQEMQARIADLEQTQQAQAQLIAVKDAELAARPAQRAGIWPWIVAALALLVAAVALLRRQPPQQQRGKVASRLSAAFARPASEPPSRTP